MICKRNNLCVDEKLVKSLYWHIIEDDSLYEYVYNRIRLTDDELGNDLMWLFKFLETKKKPISFCLRNNVVTIKECRELARILIMFFKK